MNRTTITRRTEMFRHLACLSIIPGLALSGSAMAQVLVPGSLAYGPQAMGVPTLGSLGLLLLGGVMLVFAVLALRKQSTLLSLFLMAGGAGLMTVHGPSFIDDVLAAPAATPLNNAQGGTVAVLDGTRQFENTSGVPLTIGNIVAPSCNGGSLATPGADPLGKCTPGMLLANGQICSTNFPGCATQCVPSCIGKACGDDGCSGSCGTCPDGQSCVSGNCVSDPF